MCRSGTARSEEHTSELQSLRHFVCRLLLEKKNSRNQSSAPSLFLRTQTLARMVPSDLDQRSSHRQPRRAHFPAAPGRVSIALFFLLVRAPAVLTPVSQRAPLPV